MAARIAWSQGGTASIDVLMGDRVELTSTRPFAPGSRPEGRLEDRGHPIWLKVHGSRQREDGSFRVSGRLLNVTRKMRDILKEAVSAPIGGKNPSS
jgi:hypothetical protein